MELKRILARDSRAANEKALQLYGPDVLVISSQRVDNQTELIVAIDTAQEAAAAPAQTQAEAAASREQDRFVAFSDVFKVSIAQPQASEESAQAGHEPAATRLAAKSATLTQNTPAPLLVDSPSLGVLPVLQAEPVAAPQPALAVAEKPAEKAAEVTVEVPAEVLVPAPLTADAASQAEDLRRSRDTVELLRQEIAALRQEFNLNRQVAMWQSGQGLSPELNAWFAHMQEMGVPASLRTLMADAVSECITVSEALPLVQQTLTSAVQRRKPVWSARGVHALVGPSGAGKSLMIARMAQMATSQVAAEDMAIISFADAKAGAWSQLQVLAAQSGVCCYRAADLDTLEVLLGELSHHRLIWIDTPGTDFLEQAKALQGLGTEVTLHAVLALDATVTNVRKIFDSSAVSWKSVMLTKFDEAAQPWHVLKALCDHSLPVLAVGCSHQARVAAQAFDPAALVNLALQGVQPEGLCVDAAPARKTPRRRTTASKAKALNG